MKKILLVLVLAGSIGVGIYYYQAQKTKTEEAPKQKTVKVEKGNLVSIVDTTGKVVSNLDVEIKCKASGLVTKVPFEVSNYVQVGELLVELDPIDEKRSVEQAEVALAASKAKLAQAVQNLNISQTSLEIQKKKNNADLKSAEARASDTRNKLKRLGELLKSNLSSQHEYESTEASAIEASASLEKAKINVEEIKLEEMRLELKQQDIKLAESQVKSDEINLSKTMQRLSETKVFSPIDGVVSERKIQVGQIISSGISNVGGGTTILTLSDLSRIFVVASVDESDIGQIRPDQPAIITTDAFAERQFRGQVVLISTKGITTSNVVTFEVKIEVLGHNKTLLKPEMTASIKIITAQKDNVLMVPSEAVYQRSSEARPGNLALGRGRDDRKRGERKKEGASQEGSQAGRPDRASETGEKKPDEKKPDEKKPDEKKPDEKKPDEKKPDEKKPDEKKPDEKGPKPEGPEVKEQSEQENFRKKFEKGMFRRPKKHFVLVFGEKNEIVEKDVEVGITDGMNTEIVSGVQEGDELVIEKGHVQSRWQGQGPGMRGMGMRRVMGGGGR